MSDDYPAQRDKEEKDKIAYSCTTNDMTNHWDGNRGGHDDEYDIEDLRIEETYSYSSVG